MCFNKGHFHSCQYDRPHGRRYGPKFQKGFSSGGVSEQPPSGGRAVCGTLSWGLLLRTVLPVKMQQLWFPQPPPLDSVWLNIFVDDLEDKPRTTFIQLPNSRKLGRVVNVLEDGERYENGPGWANHLVMPYSRLGQPCHAWSSHGQVLLSFYWPQRAGRLSTFLLLLLHGCTYSGWFLVLHQDISSSISHRAYITLLHLELCGLCPWWGNMCMQEDARAGLGLPSPTYLWTWRFLPVFSCDTICGQGLLMPARTAKCGVATQSLVCGAWPGRCCASSPFPLVCVSTGYAEGTSAGARDGGHTTSWALELEHWGEGGAQAPLLPQTLPWHPCSPGEGCHPQPAGGHAPGPAPPLRRCHCQELKGGELGSALPNKLPSFLRNFVANSNQSQIPKPAWNKPSRCDADFERFQSVVALNRFLFFIF